MYDFGNLLREIRQKAGKSMGDLARHLQVTVPYISDVERGHRAPLTDDRIRDIASFLNVDPGPLFKAAAQHRGVFQLGVLEGRPKSLEVGAALMRRWTELSEEELDQIEKIIGVKEQK